MKERLNRARIEWKPFFTASEFVLLDQLLYRSNLTQANNGEGFIFHVRQLEKETNVARTTISECLAQWPFIVKKGQGRTMTIHFDIVRFETWIVRHTDNDCPPDGLRSKKEEVRSKSSTKSKNIGFVRLTDNHLGNGSGMDSVGVCVKSEASPVQPEIIESRVDLQSEALSGCVKVGSPQTNDPIVRQTDNPFAELENMFEPNPLYKDMGKKCPPKVKKDRPTLEELPSDLRGFNPDN